MKYLKSYKLFESVSNFPDELDIRDIFLELLDNGIIENVKDWESGWIYFCTEKLGVGSSIRNEIYPAMIDFPDNWSDKKSIELDCKWSEIFLDLSESRNNYMLSKSFEEITTQETDLWIKTNTFVNKISNKSFRELLLESCEKGLVNSYPFFRINLGLFRPEDLDSVIECTERVYLATGFRPVRDIWDESHEESSGDIVTYYGANIQFVKCSDVEYKNLTSVFSERELEKELVKHFI